MGSDLKQEDIKNEDLKPISSKNSIPKLSTQFKLFSPPETIKDLILLRDGKLYPKCTNGHNVCVCCECMTAFCQDCKSLARHSTEVHAGNSMFFSLLNGQLICDVGYTKIKIPSLYENKIGVKWSPEKCLEGFTL